MGFEGRGFKSHHWSYVLRPIATLGQHFRAKGILDRFEATGVVVKIAEILGVEVGGSNPLTPTDSQMLDSQLGYRAFLLRQAFPNWFP